MQFEGTLHAAAVGYAGAYHNEDDTEPVGCLGGRRVHMLCPLPPRFRRTWWVKSVFSSLLSQELTVAAFLAVHVEVPLNRFPTPEVFLAAILSGGVALVVQAICAIVFQQAGRYRDILGAREVERRYQTDPLQAPAVDWATSQRSEFSAGTPDFVQQRPGPPAVRTGPPPARRAAPHAAPAPPRDNPFLGNRANYGYGAAYDARQRCGIATPAGLTVNTSRGDGPPSPPPSPPGERADGEERLLLAPTVEEYDVEAPVSEPDPGPPAAPRAIMSFCWTAQVAFALAMLLGACWISVTRKSWTNHSGALVASLFIGFGLRILLFEPLLMQLIPRCFAGRVFSENTFGTHKWEYRPPVGGPPQQIEKSASKPASEDRRIYVIRPSMQAASSTTSSARRSIGPSVSQRPSRAMSDEVEERPLLTTTTVVSI
jgi:hypothetical protein